jgi:hypothetical protein
MHMSAVDNPIFGAGEAVKQIGLDDRKVEERKLYRVGPNCETWPKTLTENPN